MLNNIINYLKKNRISTTEVADALGKKGVFKNIKPINQLSNFHKVGKIKCIFAAHKSNYLVHDGIEGLEKEDIPIIFAYNCFNNSIIGDLISKYVLLYKRAEAIVVLGCVRDAPKLIKENYPVWSEGFNPVGCKNNFTKQFPAKLKQKIKKKFENGIVVCDTTGVVAIKKRQINKKLLDKLRDIEKQEDLWYYCLDTLKWNTKDIVVKKKYLKEKKII